MTVITSKSNDVYKFVKKLSSKSAREKYGKYILEGLRLVRDAISSGASIDYIIVSSNYEGEFFDGIRTYCFDKNLRYRRYFRRTSLFLH